MSVAVFYSLLTTYRTYGLLISMQVVYTFVYILQMHACFRLFNVFFTIVMHYYFSLDMLFIDDILTDAKLQSKDKKAHVKF